MPLNLNKKDIIKKTSEVLAELDRPPRFFQDDTGKFRFFNKEGHSISLSGHTVDIFENAIKIISNFPSYRDISEKKIEDEYVQSLINILLSDPKYPEYIIKKEIDRCLKSFEESIDLHRVLIPIESFKLESIPELQIGIVRFRNQDLVLKTEIPRLLEIIDNNPTIPESQKQLEKIHLDELVLKSFSNRVCADIKVKSEVEKSFQKALYEVNQVLNLLKCYIPLLFSPGSKVQIGIYGDHNNLSAGLRSFISIYQNGGFHCSTERFGELEPYKITPDILTYLKENCYLDLLGNILAKEANSREDLENRIINAMRWIGTGIQSGNDCDKILMFVIAIECLLNQKKDESISSAIAERCAFLLSEEPDRRIKNDEKVKRLYDIRSKIVHEGLTDITAEDVGSAQWLAISCLFGICHRLKDWKNLDQIIKWTKEQRYGLENETSNKSSSGLKGGKREPRKKLTPMLAISSLNHGPLRCSRHRRRSRGLHGRQVCGQGGSGHHPSRGAHRSGLAGAVRRAAGS